MRTCEGLVLDLLAGRQTRAAALRAIAEDEGFRRREFGPAFVLMQYFGYLQRNPLEARPLRRRLRQGRDGQGLHLFGRVPRALPRAVASAFVTFLKSFVPFVVK